MALWFLCPPLLAQDVLTFDEPLVDAVEQSNITEAGRLLRDRHPPNSRGKFDVTSLMRASFKGNVTLTEMLLSAGANPNAVDVGGATALHLASREGHTDIIKMLLRYGAYVDMADAEGWTPLMRASAASRNTAVRMLMEAGADVNAVSKQNETPLIKAAEQKNAKLVRLLLMGGATPAQMSSSGRTAIDIAREKGDTEVLTLLSPYQDQVDRALTGTRAQPERGIVPVAPTPAAAKTPSFVLSVRDAPKTPVAERKTDTAAMARVLTQGGSATDISGTPAPVAPVAVSELPATLEGQPSKPQPFAIDASQSIEEVKKEAERLEAEKIAAARVMADQEEADARIQAAKKAAERVEQARMEAARQAAAAVEAARMAKAREEAARETEVRMAAAKASAENERKLREQALTKAREEELAKITVLTPSIPASPPKAEPEKEPAKEAAKEEVAKEPAPSPAPPEPPKTETAAISIPVAPELLPAPPEPKAEIPPAAKAPTPAPPKTSPPAKEAAAPEIPKDIVVHIETPEAPKPPAAPAPVRKTPQEKPIEREVIPTVKEPSKPAPKETPAESKVEPPIETKVAETKKPDVKKPEVKKETTAPKTLKPEPITDQERDLAMEQANLNRLFAELTQLHGEAKNSAPLAKEEKQTKEIPAKEISPKEIPPVSTAKQPAPNDTFWQQLAAVEAQAFNTGPALQPPPLPDVAAPPSTKAAPAKTAAKTENTGAPVPEVEVAALPSLASPQRAGRKVKPVVLNDLPIPDSSDSEIIPSAGNEEMIEDEDGPEKENTAGENNGKENVETEPDNDPALVPSEGEKARVEVAEAVRVPLSLPRNIRVIPVPHAKPNFNLRAGSFLGRVKKEEFQGYWLQVGSFDSEEAAFQHFDSVISREGLRLRMKFFKRDSEGRENVYLRVGTFNNSEEASANCSAFMTDALGCSVIYELGDTPAVPPITKPTEGRSAESFTYDAEPDRMIYWLQLGSFDDETAALNRFRELNGKHKDLLGALKPNVQVPKTIMYKENRYQLRAGPVESRHNANDLCRKLKAAEVPCMAVRGD